MDPLDELLEEPLFLDGIAIRRWSDLARLRRPGETAAADGRGDGWTDPVPEPVPAVP